MKLQTLRGYEDNNRHRNDLKYGPNVIVKIGPPRRWAVVSLTIGVFIICAAKKIAVRLAINGICLSLKPLALRKEKNQKTAARRYIISQIERSRYLSGMCTEDHQYYYLSH
jgi:hypothetical protein